jgi:DNA-directed RNA polymerase subunit L
MTKTIKSITVDDEIWNAAKIQAEKENRTLSNFIATILKRYLEEQKEKEKPQS